MKTISSKSIFALGFVVILVMQTTVMVMWVADIERQNNRLHHIVDEQYQRELISEMRDIAYQRTNVLYHMADIEDPFDRDEEYMKFQSLAEQFIKARDDLFSNMDDSRDEKKLWQAIKPLMTKGGQLQNKAAQLILDDKAEEAELLLVNAVTPAQNDVVEMLKNIFLVQRDDISEDMEEAKIDSDTSYRLVFTAGSITLAIIFFMLYVIKRTGSTESALLEQGERIRLLYEVTATSGRTKDEQIIDMLEAGCRFLGLDMGKVCKIDTVNNTNTVLNIYSATKSDLHAGSVLPLNETFCNLVFSSEKEVAVNDIGNSVFDIFECYEKTRLESYIATHVYLYGKKYGTVNFSSMKARKKDFTPAEKDLVKLIGSWISAALEQKNAHEELIDAKVEVEQATKTEGKFLAKMSHELRTPLNAIIGYSDLLIEESAISAEDLEDIKKINKSGVHLLALINDVLDLSKIESGKMKLEIEDIDVSEIVDVVATVSKPLVSKNKNIFNSRIHSNLNRVRADSVKLKQVLLNLVKNANKYTKEGEIRLQVSQLNERGVDWIIFSIVDNGIGVSPEQQELVFQAFSQIEKTDANSGHGVGLGLTISRQLCRMMGGDISVISDPGQGAVFSVALPASKAQVREDEDDSASYSENKSRLKLVKM